MLFCKGFEQGFLSLYLRYRLQLSSRTWRRGGSEVAPCCGTSQLPGPARRQPEADEGRAVCGQARAVVRRGVAGKATRSGKFLPSIRRSYVRRTLPCISAITFSFSLSLSLSCFCPSQNIVGMSATSKGRVESLYAVTIHSLPNPCANPNS